MQKMKAKTFLVLCAAAISLLAANRHAVAAHAGQPATGIPPPAKILASLRAEHPRLLATSADFARLKEKIKSDPQLKKWHGQLREQAEKILKDPPSKYEIPDGLRLLSTSRRVLHRVALLNRSQVLVQDEVQADQPSEVWWFLHTPALIKVSDDGRTATLSQGSSRLLARILSPAKAAFMTMDAQPLPTSPHPEKQAKNEKVRKLAIHLKNVEELRLAVLLVPLREEEVAPARLPEVVRLADW